MWASADVRRRWPSLVVLAVLTAIPVGAVLALVAGARRADTSIDRFAEELKAAGRRRGLHGGRTGPLIEQLAGDPRVSSIEQSRTVGAVAEPMEFGQFGFSLIGADDASPGGLGRPLLIDGRYPAVGSTDEILVNERSAEAWGFEVGQRTSLSGATRWNLRRRFPLGEAEIVGIVRLSFDLVDETVFGRLRHRRAVFVDGRWQQLASIGSIVWISLHDRADEPALISELSQRVVRGDVLGTAGLLGSAQRAVDLQHRGLLLAAAVVGVTGLVAITQAVARHLSPRREDDEVLAAIGLTPKGACPRRLAVRGASAARRHGGRHRRRRGVLSTAPARPGPASRSVAWRARRLVDVHRRRSRGGRRRSDGRRRGLLSARACRAPSRRELARQ